MAGYLPMSWLVEHNPDIDWTNGKIKWRSEHCRKHCLPSKIKIEWMTEEEMLREPTEQRHVFCMAVFHDEDGEDISLRLIDHYKDYHQQKSQFASRIVTSVRRSGRAIANLARLGVPLFLQTFPCRGATSGSVRHSSGDRASLLKLAAGSPFSPGRLPGAFWRSRTFARTTSGRSPAFLRFAGRVPLSLG